MVNLAGYWSAFLPPAKNVTVINSYIVWLFPITEPIVTR